MKTEEITKGKTYTLDKISNLDARVLMRDILEGEKFLCVSSPNDCECPDFYPISEKVRNLISKHYKEKIDFNEDPINFFDSSGFRMTVCK